MSSNVMDGTPRPAADALVFVGAAGDLACRRVFPALPALVKRGHLDAPVTGVVKPGWHQPLPMSLDPAAMRAEPRGERLRRQGRQRS